MKIFIQSLLLFITVATQAQTPIDPTQLVNDIRTLSSDKYEGRMAGTRGSRQAQFYLISRFREIGLQSFHNTFEYPFYFPQGDKQIMGTNLFGYIKGTSDAAIVVTAHYDHLGIKRDAQGKDSIFNGADDNASGVGGLLALMAYYKKHQPRHTIIFAALDGEEEGLQGAKAFVKQPPVPVSQIVLNINMDMIGRNDKQELYVCGLAQFPELKPYVDAGVAAGNVIKLLSGHDRKEEGAGNWLNQSDHYEFYKLKIPFLYFGVEDHPDYHQLSDEFSGIQPAFYYQAVLKVLSVLESADKGLQ
ncbi:M28 family peptidase [Chitinophaga pinensis]|uniref:Peptidase M28 n=1 Tax=Chitinophaga pinensis (strain ATCC 43595 / DSM 2588 / LMG 13176 / NBRC 15968 / NCIMB 11800 / UQM 2034) TaxID=485918 RepID=A0A979G024_CHIPD|nr:M28 family peptidase [Chitinophaga pinensis]ACU58283.1 peptidase M28 [Chitinophaga pinensis DSM 2588]